MKFVRTPERHKEIREILIRHYNHDETLKKISTSLGLSYTIVTSLAREQRKRMLARIKSGEPHQKIADDLELTPNTVARIVEIEVEREAASAQREQDLEDERQAGYEVYLAESSVSIYERFRDGEEVETIAQSLEMARESVLRIIEIQLSAIVRR